MAMYGILSFLATPTTVTILLRIKYKATRARNKTLKKTESPFFPFVLVVLRFFALFLSEFGIEKEDYLAKLLAGTKITLFYAP